METLRNYLYIIEDSTEFVKEIIPSLSFSDAQTVNLLYVQIESQITHQNHSSFPTNRIPLPTPKFYQVVRLF